MIGFASPARYPLAASLSPDFVDWPFIDGIFRRLPERFAQPVGEKYRREWKRRGQRAANTWLREEVAAGLGGGAAGIAASDADLCRLAANRAGVVRQMLARETGTDAATMAGKLRRFAAQAGAALPKDCTLRGLIARLTDAAFWRRHLRRTTAREVERHAIGLGLVHRRAGLYASDETVERRAQQGRRNAKALAETEAVNEAGQSFTLAELSEKGVSNPRIRRAELMTRIKGFEDFAVGAGHVGMFYTATAPSRMHARLSDSGRENPKYDGTAPKECAGYLAKTWAKARAWLHRRGIYVYGFRVAEPHHDGTPHWHMLLFMVAEAVESVTHCLRRYFCEADAHELASEQAQAARFNATVIDWSRGTAAGYIAKYIAKNIDGQKNDLSGIGEDFEAPGQDAKDTAPRVLAWASCWGIRQFQQIGGPGVTIWRELRRIREMDHQGELFPHWSAADAGNFGRYVETMGGAAIRRDLRPLQLWREALPGKVNRYGEKAAPEVCGVQVRKEMLPVVRRINYETRIHQWAIRRVGNVRRSGNRVSKGVGGSGHLCGGVGVDRGIRMGFQQGDGVLGFQAGAAGPWTRVNNCTRGIPWSPEEGATSGHDMDGFDIGGFAEEAREFRKRAVFAAIDYRRKAGAFGKFPAPPGERGKHVG